MSNDPKPPQEKKRLSYQRDRRNDYGENNKSSRKNIALSKALAIRSDRHGQNRALQCALPATTEEQALEAELRSKEGNRRWWFKVPDTPLGEVVAARLARRRKS